MLTVTILLGILSMAKLAQRWGRRPAFDLALLLSFLSTLLVFMFMRVKSDLFWMLPLMGFGQFGVFAVYLPELFPTSLRSTGTSFCYNVGRLVGIAVLPLLPETKRVEDAISRGAELDGMPRVRRRFARLHNLRARFQEFLHLGLFARPCFKINP